MYVFYTLGETLGVLSDRIWGALKCGRRGVFLKFKYEGKEKSTQNE